MNAMARLGGRRAVSRGGSSGGYPWSDGDILFAADLNAAFLPVTGGGTVSGTTTFGSVFAAGLGVTGTAVISTLQVSAPFAVPAISNGTAAAPGFVGELLKASLAAPGTALTTNIIANLLQLSLTAGDWDVWSVVDTTVGGSTVQSGFYAGLSSSPTAFAGYTTTSAPYVAIAGAPVILNTVPVPISTASSLTVYLNIQGSFSGGTCSGGGVIYARRRR